MNLDRNIKYLIAGLIGGFLLRGNISISGAPKIGNGLRSVEVTYDTGDVVKTAMAAHLSDEQIRDYFKPGTIFNIGSNTDKLAAVTKVKILR